MGKMGRGWGVSCCRTVVQCLVRIVPPSWRLPMGALGEGYRHEARGASFAHVHKKSGLQPTRRLPTRTRGAKAIGNYKLNNLHSSHAPSVCLAGRTEHSKIVHMVLHRARCKPMLPLLPRYDTYCSDVPTANGYTFEHVIPSAQMRRVCSPRPLQPRRQPLPLYLGDPLLPLRYARERLEAPAYRPARPPRPPVFTYVRQVRLQKVYFGS